MPPDPGPWILLAVIVSGMLVLALLVLRRDAMPLPLERAAARSVVPPGAAALARVGMGVALGMAVVGLFAGLAALRDAGLAWLVLDAVVLGASGLVVGVGLWVLREMQARSEVVRGWATVGAALLLVLALFIGLD